MNQRKILRVPYQFIFTHCETYLATTHLSTVHRYKVVFLASCFDINAPTSHIRQSQQQMLRVQEQKLYIYNRMIFNYWPNNRMHIFCSKLYIVLHAIIWSWFNVILAGKWIWPCVLNTAVSGALQTFQWTMVLPLKLKQS